MLYYVIPNIKTLVEALKMAIKYYKLLDLLNRSEISKEDLRLKISVSSATMAKIAKHQFVSLDVIDKICNVLHCQPGDIMEHVPDTDNT